MAYDRNECIFSGTISELREIQTRTGTPMLTMKLKCWREQLKIVAFNELATETLQTFSDDDRVQISGKFQSTSWEHDGVKKYGFQIIADNIIKEGEEDRGNNPSPFPSQDEPPLPPEPKEMPEQPVDEFAYKGGPF